jgi:hypothetical protein
VPKFEKLKSMVQQNKETLILLGDFLLSKEILEINELKKIKLELESHQSLSNHLCNILLSCENGDFDVEDDDSYEKANHLDILDLLGNFLISKRIEEFGVFNNNPTYKIKLKLLGIFLMSDSSKEAEGHKKINFGGFNLQERLKLLEGFLTSKFVKVSEHIEYDKNDDKYQKRLKFLGDYIFFEDFQKKSENERLCTIESYDEMMKLFKKTFKPNNNVSEDSDGTSFSEGGHQKVLDCLRKTFSSDILTKVDFVEILSSEIKDHHEALSHLSKFLIFDGIEGDDLKAKELNKIEQHEKMLGDAPTGVELTDVQLPTELNTPLLQKRALPSESRQRNLNGQSFVSPECLRQQVKLELLGEFLIKGILKKSNAELKDLYDTNANYKKRLNFLGDFLTFKNPLENADHERWSSIEDYQEINHQFQKFAEEKGFKLVGEDEELDLLIPHHKALERLISIFISEPSTTDEYLEKLNSECKEHRETLDILGDFLLADVPKKHIKNQPEASRDQETMMLADSPSPGRNIDDVGTQEGSDAIDVVEQVTQHNDLQASSRPSNDVVRDGSINNDVIRRQKLNLLGEFFITSGFTIPNAIDRGDVNYQKKLKFLGDLILSENSTEKTKHKRMSNDEDFKEMLTKFKDSDKYSKLINTDSGDGLRFNQDFQEVVNILKKFLLSDEQSGINDLKILGSKPERDKEALVLLGDFLLFDEPIRAESQKKTESSKIVKPEVKMQGDSPLINKTTDNAFERELDSNDVKEEENHLETMQSDSPKPNKLRNAKKQAQKNNKRASVKENKSDLQADEAVSKPTKSESTSEKLVVIKNGKDLNSATAEKPKTYGKENFKGSSLKNHSNEQIRSNSGKLENQKVYKQFIIPDETKRYDFFRTPDSLNQKHVVTGEPKISKPRDIEVKPQNSSQKKGPVHVFRKLQDEEVQNPITLTFTVTRSNK